VISQNTWDMVQGQFNVEALGEFQMKGLTQKMPVYAVLDDGTAQTARSTSSGTIPSTPPPS
jgi:class 3 adenylate cyclase